MPSISSRQRPAGLRNLRVVAIGGGTGLSTLLKGLKKYVADQVRALRTRAELQNFVRS